MKLLAGMGVLIFLVVLLYAISMSGAGDKETTLLPIAFGEPSDGRIEMHAIVGVTMANVDRLQEGKIGPTNWSQWIERHFTLSDANGEEIEGNQPRP